MGTPIWRRRANRAKRRNYGQNGGVGRQVGFFRSFDRVDDFI